MKYNLFPAHTYSSVARPTRTKEKGEQDY